METSQSDDAVTENFSVIAVTSVVDNEVLFYVQSQDAYSWGTYASKETKKKGYRYNVTEFFVKIPSTFSENNILFTIHVTDTKSLFDSTVKTVSESNRLIAEHTFVNSKIPAPFYYALGHYESESFEKTVQKCKKLKIAVCVNDYNEFTLIVHENVKKVSKNRL